MRRDTPENPAESPDALSAEQSMHMKKLSKVQKGITQKAKAGFTRLNTNDIWGQVVLFLRVESCTVGYLAPPWLLTIGCLLCLEENLTMFIVITYLQAHTKKILKIYGIQ